MKDCGKQRGSKLKLSSAVPLCFISLVASLLICLEETEK